MRLGFRPNNKLRYLRDKKMNRVKNWLLCLLVFVVTYFLLTNPDLTFAATLALNPSSGTFNRGCSFSIKIDLDTQGIQTDGTDAILNYDPTRVTPQTIISGSIYPDYPGNFIDVQARKINISGLASVQEPFSGSGTLATVNFTIPQNAPTGLTQIILEFDPNNKTKTTDSNVVERGTVADVLNAVVNGSYTIGTGTCVGPGSSPSPGSGRGQPGSTLLPLATFAPVSSSPSATPLIELSPGGKQPGLTGPTLILTIVGSVLTVLGILGLALL